MTSYYGATNWRNEQGIDHEFTDWVQVCLNENKDTQQFQRTCKKCGHTEREWRALRE